MRIWVALIVAPLLALVDQTVAFSLVHWACAHQSTWVVHLTHIVFLVIVAAAAGGAWLGWLETSVVAGIVEPASPVHFLAGVATMIAMLSAVAIVAMWIATWMISPCVA